MDDYKLPVFGTISAGLRNGIATVAHHPIAVVLFVLAYGALLNLVLVSMIAGFMQLAYPTPLFAGAIVLMIVLDAVLALLVHNESLRGPVSVEGAAFEGRFTRILRYFGTGLIIMLWVAPFLLLAMALGPMIGGPVSGGSPETAGMVGNIVQAVATLIWLVLAGRLALKLPAIALDERFSFEQSWWLSAGNTFRLFVMALLPIVILGLLWFVGFQLVMGSIGTLMAAGPPTVTGTLLPWILPLALMAIGQAIFIIFGAGILSAVWSRLATPERMAALRKFTAP